MYIKTLLPRTHARTIILLHGMNQDISEMLNITKYINKHKKGNKFIIPIADKIDIDWPNGKEKNISSWYNYFTRYDNKVKHDIIDSVQLKNITSEIVNIIKNESKIVDPSNISLIGISQGGTVCINAALMLNFKIKNVICIDTIFLHTYFDFKFFKNNSCKDFKVFQSSRDTIYNPFFQDYCYDILRNYNKTIEKKIFNLSHCENMNTIASFIILYL